MKLSVIIPVYNTEKYLAKCLDSVLKESLKDMEIIIINDGSSDNSLEIIKKYKEKYKNIVSINQENSGQGVARNEGIKRAKGDYLCFVDSDDFINPGSLTKAVNMALEKDLDILYWNIDWVYEDGKIKHQNIFNPAYRKTDNIGYLLSDPSPCNKLIRTSLLKDNNLFFPVDCIYEDFALIPSLVKYAKNIEYTDTIVYNYYQRKNSTMNQTSYNKKVMDILKAYKHLYKRVSKEYIEELEYIAIMQIIYFKTFELLKYNKKEEIDECRKFVNELFPNWIKNKYFLKRNKMIIYYCKSIKARHYRICKSLKTVRNLIRK